jgi:hypothetical protein
MKQKHFNTAAKYIRSFKNGNCIKCGIYYPFYILDFHHLHDKHQNLSNSYGTTKAKIHEEISKCKLICANCHRDHTHNNQTPDVYRKNRQHKPEIIDIMSLNCKSKICKICKENKNIENFTLLKTGYRHTYCKKCLRDYNNKLNKKCRKTRFNILYLTSVKDNAQCTDCKKIFRHWMLDFDHVKPGKYKNISQLKNRKLSLLKEEIEKCELVCVNCHRVRTYKRKYET